MAMSPSPQLSPVLGPTYKMERHHTNSPPQQLSKRDKRRTLLADRLEEITRHFSQNRDVHYREQLQALQIDMNLIMEADAHGKEPLPSGPDDIEVLVEENIKAVRKTLGAIPPPRAGKIYAAFAKEINDAIEERDTGLSMHMVSPELYFTGGVYLTGSQRHHELKMSELNAAHAYRMKLAAGEHRALASTLRDRLVNSITSKKNRLSKDKDSLEISDSNALLLHPNQFGITNPSSPGIHGKRATRGRRDPDDLSSFADGNKRKRKAADSDESPAPTRQRLDNDNSTPLWFSEKQRMAAQQAGAVFSIDKLFTDKELSMTYNTAALAAHTHMQRHHPYNDDFYAANDRSDGSTDADGAAGENDGDEDDESLPSGAGMERQYSHATRSTRAANSSGNFITGLGIDAITDLNYPGNMAALTKQIPKLPPPLASVMQKGYIKGEGANGVQGLSQDDAMAEIELMRQARLYNDHKGIGRNLDLDNGGRHLLEAAAATRRYLYFVRSGGQAPAGGVVASAIATFEERRAARPCHVETAISEARPCRAS